MMKVDIKMATLWRGGHAVKALQTLISQPEFGSADVTCNNWTDAQWSYITNELKDERIRLHRHDNEKGSNEKFRYVGVGNSEYIGFFDDDILYASDYLHKLIEGCDYYNSMVSCHGVILDKGKIQSYYRNRRVFPALGEVLKSTEVDIASNCGSLFKRKWFTNYDDWYDMVSEVSMDDLYTAYFMKKKGIHRFVLKHPKDYLQHKVQEVDDDYVFDKYALTGNDEFQTMFINSFYKKL